MNANCKQRRDSSSFAVVRRHVNEVITVHVPDLFIQLIASFQPASQASFTLSSTSSLPPFWGR
ncbi:hypothetical protein EON63_25270, partial [archaeon]